MKYNDLKDDFLSQFPNDADSWKYATDEIRDFARDVRSTYNEMVLDVLEDSPGAVHSLNFRKFLTPSEWNTGAKAQINELWDGLPDNDKHNILQRFI